MNHSEDWKGPPGYYLTPCIYTYTRVHAHMHVPIHSTHAHMYVLVWHTWYVNSIRGGLSRRGMHVHTHAHTRTHNTHTHKPLHLERPFLVRFDLRAKCVGVLGRIYYGFTEHLLFPCICVLCRTRIVHAHMNAKARIRAKPSTQYTLHTSSRATSSCSVNLSVWLQAVHV